MAGLATLPRRSPARKRLTVRIPLMGWIFLRGDGGFRRKMGRDRIIVRMPLTVRPRLDPRTWTWRLAGRRLQRAAGRGRAPFIDVNGSGGWSRAEARASVVELLAVVVEVWDCSRQPLWMDAITIVPPRAPHGTPCKGFPLEVPRVPWLGVFLWFSPLDFSVGIILWFSPLVFSCGILLCNLVSPLDFSFGFLLPVFSF